MFLLCAPPPGYIAIVFVTIESCHLIKSSRTISRVNKLKLPDVSGTVCHIRRPVDGD
jgi:hypothetical protein